MVEARSASVAAGLCCSATAAVVATTVAVAATAVDVVAAGCGWAEPVVVAVAAVVGTALAGIATLGIDPTGTGPLRSMGHHCKQAPHPGTMALGTEATSTVVVVAVAQPVVEEWLSMVV